MAKGTTNPVRPGRKTNKAGNIDTSGTSGNNTNTTNNTTSDTTRNDNTSEPTGSPNNHAETDQKPPRLVILDKPPTEDKPKRNRPTGLTYNKAAKVNAANKSGGAGAGAVVMIQSLIQGVFLIGATRLGEHWVLTDEEADAIASPAANIMAKYIDADKLAKFSDPAALVFALGAVMLPRVMIQVQMKPKKEVKPIEPDKRVTGASGQDAGNSPANGGNDSGKNAADASPGIETDVEKLLRDALNQPY